MKQLSSFLGTILITLSVFTTTIFTSCTKDNTCKSMVCKNASICQSGTCICPTGYTGQYCEESVVVYYNGSYTPITITVNNSTHLIPVGGNYTFYGLAGSPANGTASTFYTDNNGKRMGEVVTWQIADKFPSDGNKASHLLDVSSDYFYLKIANGDYYDSVVALKVNYDSPDQVADSILLPNNGQPYVIGYYKALPGTKILAMGVGAGYTGSSWVLVPKIQNSSNATAIVSVP